MVQLQTTNLGAPDVRALRCSAVSLLRRGRGGGGNPRRGYGRHRLENRGAGSGAGSVGGRSSPLCICVGGRLSSEVRFGEQGTSSGGWGWRGRGRGGRRRPHRQQGDPSVLNHIRQRWLTVGRCKVACGNLHRKQRSPGLWGLGRPSYEPRTLQQAVEKVRAAEALTALPHLHLAMMAQGKCVA